MRATYLFASVPTRPSIPKLHLIKTSLEVTNSSIFERGRKETSLTWANPTVPPLQRRLISHVVLLPLSWGENQTPMTRGSSVPSSLRRPWLSYTHLYMYYSIYILYILIKHAPTACQACCGLIRARPAKRRG